MRMFCFNCRSLLSAALMVLSCITVELAYSQQASLTPIHPPIRLFTEGTVKIQDQALSLEILRYSGTAASLRPTLEATFDYTPGDMLAQRSADTYYHLGDLDLRVRRKDTSHWIPISTAFRRKPVVVLSSNPTEFRSDVTGSLPKNIGLEVIRAWKVEQGELQLQFTITNTRAISVELGGVGIPMVFNNIMSNRTLEEAYERCSFYDPYIGLDAGYVQVVPLKGTGPVLLIAPLRHTPLEAWKPILSEKDKTTDLGKLENDPTPRGVTFEGSFDWMVHTAAFAETEWKGIQEWNPATSETLTPGESITFGLRFVVAPDVRSIEQTLVDHHRPVAIGIPGYVLPQDMEGRLFLNYSSPVRSIVAEPSGSIRIHDDGILASGLHAYTLRGVEWGTSRLKITYQDGLVQPIAYRTIKPERQAITDLGHFLFHEQWLPDKSDPFGRAPSVVSYDNEAHRQVLQEHRAWIAGLSDEAGAGSYLAAAMKEFLDPKAEEIAKFEEFVDCVLWGHLQIAEGAHRYGVRKSLFYYQPDAVPNFRYSPEVDQKWIWDQKEASRLDRTYNYPHVVAAYWALYKVARNTKGIVVKHPWDWYLNQAYCTAMAMKTEAAPYIQYGLMEGTVFTYLLDDLRAEGWDEKADALEALMRERAERWQSEPYPFGSEMPWDSTDQEEVYAWTKRFGDRKKAEVTLNAILGYTPTIPNWGYNGSARRYWDFGTAGKYGRLERMLHHYGSGLNAIPLLTEFRDHPEDLYLLRVGYGGVMGALTNIDENGFGSTAFHAFPDRLAFDPYSGDYGSNFFGHAVNTGVYVVHDKTLGWLCFGGNLRQNGSQIRFSVLDRLSQAGIHRSPEAVDHS